MKVPHLWTTAGTAALCCASISNAEIITVSISGFFQNIDDPNNYLMGGDRWIASIDIDSQNTVTSDLFDSTRFYTGEAIYTLGNRAEVSVSSRLQVSNGTPDDPNGSDFDVLAIKVNGIGLIAGDFFALDFSALTLDSRELPPLGLTFDDGFTPGIVGTDLDVNGTNFELVADTISVTPTPSSATLIAIAGLAATKRRR